MNQQQVGGSVGGPIARDRTFYFTNLERRTRSVRARPRSPTGNVAAINARLAAVGYPGSPVTTGVYPNPVKSTHYLGKIDHQVSRARPVQRPLLPLRRVVAERARRRRAQRAERLVRPRQHRSDGRLQQYLDAVAADGQRNTGAGGARRSARAGDRPDRARRSASPAWRRSARSSGSPTGASTRCIQVVNNLSHQAGAHALRAGIDILYNDDTITYPRSIRGAYTFSSLANFLAGVYNNTGLHADVRRRPSCRRPIRTSASTRRTSGRSRPSLTLNAGPALRPPVPADDPHRSQQPVAARRLRVVPVRLAADASSAAAAGSSSTACRCARWRTRCSRRTTRATWRTCARSASACRRPGRRAGVSRHPAAAGPVRHAAQPDDDESRICRTRYSRQASVEVEQQIGERSTVSAGYQYTGGRSLIISVNQNVPSCAAAGTNNGCRPNPDLRQQQPVLARRRSPAITACTSPSCSGRHGGATTASATPFEGDDERRASSSSARRSIPSISRRTGAARTTISAIAWWSTARELVDEPASTSWQHLIHGFQLSGMVQSYSALPFNITSGVTTLQGTAGRPIVDGAFIPRNAGIGATSSARACA